MNFEMTDDRRMLAESLSRFLNDACPIEARATLAYESPFHSKQAWDGLVELGALYALVPEARGGMGGTGFDIAVVFEALGRALCPEPMLPALMAAQLLAAADRTLEPLLSGLRYAVGIGELDAPYDLETIATSARLNGDSWTLSGRKSVVYGGGVAERILVLARAEGALALFEVDADVADITPYGMIDGGPAAEIFLDDAPAEMLLPDAKAAARTALDAGVLALSAEALGAMQTATDMLTDYLKTRQQFGQKLGAFQALQHRAVTLMIEIEQARSSVILAADALGEDKQSYRISQAKHLVGIIARQVSEETIQMHGGIGITWEYPLAHYAKRLVMIDHQLGDTDHHLERLMGEIIDG
ncbi:acyl-CoA dehydrogenase [Gymnodinialimonas sp. 2305UL16-5]|uniref:acyl-CoA dehydrogenase family protein n=1 Tax=Gymnodinialimonas mytili TaxID=3126503 RepID=UPI0030A46E22